MYGKDYNYARTRIEGTIVRIRKTNEPVHVQNVSRANGVCSVSLINDIDGDVFLTNLDDRSEEHTSELQSLMRISYAVFCLKKKKTHNNSTILLTTYKSNTKQT